MKLLVLTLLIVLGAHGVAAKTPLTPADVSAIEVTAKAFAAAFKDNDADTFQKLLITHTAFADIVPANSIGANTYNELIAGNLACFKEWRSAFSDLKQYDVYWKIIVLPGERSAHKVWISPEAVIHNTFVELHYANRIKITLKLEDLVLAGGKCHILQID